MQRLRRALLILRQRGPGFVLYLLRGYLWPRLWYHFLFTWPRQQLRRAGRIGLSLFGGLFVLGLHKLKPTRLRLFVLTGASVLTALFAYLATRLRRRQIVMKLKKEQQTVGAGDFTRWLDMPIPETTRIAVKTAMGAKAELLLGHIDKDGRVYCPYGPLPYVANIASEEFVPRRRFPVDIVLRDSFVLIRKDFRGEQKPFLREWQNLMRLSGLANVPAVYMVDELSTLLYKNFIRGRVIRDILVEAGARIWSVQTEKDPELQTLTYPERIDAVLARGTARLSETFPETFIDALETQINNIHRQGVANLSLTFGNVMQDEQGQPWLIDMEGAETFATIHSPMFHLRRDQDRDKFNQYFARSIFTERSARSSLDRLQNSLPHWYAPIDFGNGLAINGFWSIDAGSGRWEHFNAPIMRPLITGKRILDLGSNHGLMPLLMLRAGASEVHGIELDTRFIAASEQIHRLFEWRDICHYAFHCYQANMTDILHQDWGRYDVITALCTLYYLSEEEMKAVVHRSAEMAPLMIVQANDATRKEAGHNKQIKSSTQYLLTLLQNNGFNQVKVYGYGEYVRPLLVARSTLFQ